MAFQTKKEIEDMIGQIQFLVSKINDLIVNVGNICKDIKSRAGLYNYLQGIIVTLSEARDLFNGQVVLYIDLLNQYDEDVEAAKETLKKIEGKGYEIVMKKGRLKYQLIVFPQMMMVYGTEKKLPLPVEANLVAVQKELELIAK